MISIGRYIYSETTQFGGWSLCLGFDYQADTWVEPSEHIDRRHYVSVYIATNRFV